MRRVHNLVLTLAIALCSIAAVAQNGFNYQAVIRNSQGDLVANHDISLRISLISGNTILYQEQQTATTNAYGVVSVVVGTGTPLSGSFTNIDWTKGNISMKTEFDPNGNDNFAVIGTTQLQAVPFAEHAKTSSAVKNPKDIQIQATSTTGDDEALFSVKDEEGNVVFAVYKSGVRVYVDDTDSGNKAAKSGFAVTGRKAKDGEANTYFAVDNYGTQVYVDDEGSDKAAKAKFAVTSVKKGKDGDKAEVENYLVVNKQGTQVYVDGDESSGKAAKAKFAVTSVKKGKATTEDNVFVINEEGTKVFVDDEGSDKAAKAKFAVTSVKKGKDGETAEVENYLVVNKQGTQVYVDGDEDTGKAAKAKFAVTSVKKGKATTEDNVFVINEEGTNVFVDDQSDGKAAKAKFAVTSVKKGKDGESLADNYLVVNDEGTKVYVDGDDSKAAKAKFAVTSVRSGKADEADDFFLINKDGTQVFIDDEPQGKAAKAKFAVTSVKKGKGDNGDNPDYLVVDSDSTRVYIDNANSKAAKSGFAVTGKKASKGSNADMLKVTQDSTRVYVEGGSSKSGFGVEGKDGASNGKSGFAVSEKSANGNAGYMDVTAKNFFAGYNAGKKTIPVGLYGDGTNNTFVGNNAGIANTSGRYNTFLGSQAGFYNEGGDYNLFLGNEAGYKNVKGGYNVYLGYQAGYSATSSQNVFVGVSAGSNVEDGCQNVYLGTNAGRNNKSGGHNVMVGEQAGDYSEGSTNVFLGLYSGLRTNGELNTFIGPFSGENLITGSRNVYISAQGEESESDKLRIGNLIYGDFLSKEVTIDAYTTIGRGLNSLQIFAEELSVNSIVKTDLIPYINCDLGSTSNRWDTVFAKVLNTSGNVTIGGNTTFDGSATFNGSITQIKSTYTTLSGGLSAKTGYFVSDNSGVTLHVDNQSTNKTETIGIETFAEGENSNGANYGIFSKVSNGKNNYGVYGYASGNTGTKYGVYGKADGSGTNWAGYFAGDVKVTGTLTTSSSATVAGNLTVNGTDGVATTKLSASGDATVSGKLTLNGNVASNLVPSAASYNLGANTTTGRWSSVFAKDLNISGNITSNLVPSAASYNLGTNTTTGRWSTVYAKDLNASGNATISGTATVTGALTASSSATVGGKLTVNGTDGVATTKLSVSGNVASTLKPSGTSYDLGGISTNEYRWNTVYAQTGDFKTSSNQVAVNAKNSTGSTSAKTYGVNAEATGTKTATNSINYGVKGIANNAYKNYGVYGEASVQAYSYALYANGNAGGSSAWDNTSDGRLKKDVQTLTGALEKVLKLRGVSFYWKNREEMASAKGISVDNFDYNYDSNKHIGVIAQELEAEYPELVKTDGEGFKSVEYSTLGPILIEAVKELKAEKDALEATVANQQKENEAMKKEMAEMKKMLEELMKK